jgi:hypothetical protein
MPLSKQEREFLDAYVYEATHQPFGGPATADLQQRGIRYADLHWLLTAYERELSAERILPFGCQNLTPPPTPWANLEDAKLRNQTLKREHGEADKAHSLVNVAPNSQTRELNVQPPAGIRPVDK